VVPTWRNGRTGEDEISKRLDRVYVLEDLISTTVRYRSWADYPYVSDHAPVLLQLGFNINTVAHPFKLKLAWLRDDTFALIVQEVWNDHLVTQEAKAQRRLVEKLKQLKLRVKTWAKEKKTQDHSTFEKIEEELDFHYKQKSKGLKSSELDLRLKLLESKRNKHLLAEEELWCQKSRAIWIQSGDKNTIFFHQFASHRRNTKHIWEIKDEKWNGSYRSRGSEKTSD
jgi:hypothetical protein